MSETNAVERVELGDGLEISRLLTGLWQVADIERDQALEPAIAAQELIPYVERGLTTFDMADHYGSAEEIVGALSRHKERVDHEALTKWVPKPGPITRDQVREAVERALTRLGRERIDLLQFHAWCYWHPSYLDGLFYLQELQQQGLIRHLGLTNCDAAHLNLILASGIRVVSNQVCFSLLDARPRGPLSAVCAAHGVKLLAYGTLAGGFLTQRWLGMAEPTPETWSQMKYKRFIDAAGGWDALQKLLQVVAVVARRHGVSIANVASRYILEQPAVAGIIVGARLGEREHIEDNLRIFDFALNDESRTELDDAIAALRPIPGDSGDEYRHPPYLTASGDLSHHVDELPPPFATVVGAAGRRRAFSGVSWEGFAGYCRAIRHGDCINVSGTTASHGDRLIGGSDVAAQTLFAIDKIEGALRSLGGRLEDVVRTRLFVSNARDWEQAARVHGQRFASIQPANTLVEARLIGDEYLVEVEAEAVVSDRSATDQYDQ